MSTHITQHMGSRNGHSCGNAKCIRIPFLFRIAARKIISHGKRMVKENRFVTTKEVMATMEAMAAEQDVSGSSLGRTSNVKHRMNDTKRKTHGLVSIGTCREDIVIPNEYKKTLTGHNFLLHDNNDGSNRMLVFASPDSLDVSLK